MATVVLQYAGAAVGNLIGGPVGGIIGRAVGAVAGNMLDQAFFSKTRRVEGPRLDDLRVMASSEGTPIPRLWGRMRVAGQVIWATNFEEVKSTHTEKSSSKGGAGGTKVSEYSYFANCAVALCEGVIGRVGRVWADGKELDLEGLTCRLYTGTETQDADSLIVAKEGADAAPAYRGLAYIVFEHLPLESFGNRLPQLSFEVIRPAGGAETLIRAVNIIPGSTEFGYDTVIQTRDLGQGITESENAHASAARSDWMVSLDDLTETCANVKAASLVVAWFADDLRCGTAELKPGVDSASKVTEPDSWRVAGLTRATAHLVSTVDGGAAYGGTPSDKSVIRAITDMKARGLKLVFNPFILMDIPAGNGKPDPYGAAEQGAFPWRGRMTCHPAPGRSGTPDKTAAVVTQINAFIGTATAAQFGIADGQVTYSGPAEWSLRRMVLHYAKLCAIAGGVEAFLIGSELRGLTTLRGSANSYPFVQALVALAAEVKTILPAAKVSYAADWTEYFGHQPADGSNDCFFHLDPLWSSANVDFIGIDNYMPLADWRDGAQHTDRLAGVTSIHDLAYLKRNIAGGEGFDWYYAGDAARQVQARSAITDGAYGKPWVFRYKDLKSWWLNPHYNRPGGVEQGSPTGWTPQSKPIWFTEAGCPAIDKGANQPNAFVDAKSSETLLPYFSGGQRDDLMQNRHVTALTDYWGRTGAHNPISSVYGSSMVAADRMFFWAWDARPFPFFPARADVWSDAVNYGRGHWLNGRIGAVPLAQLIVGVCAAYGFADVDVSTVEGLVDGFVIDRPMAARDALEDLLGAFAVDALERDGKLFFTMRKRDAVLALSPDDFAEKDRDQPLFSLTRAQETELPANVRVAYTESALDYRRATVEAKRLGVSSSREITVDLPCAVGQAVAQMRADVALQDNWAGRDTISFALGPDHIELEPGDVFAVTLASGPRSFRIEEISDGGMLRISARAYQAQVYDAPGAPGREAAAAKVFVYGTPDALFMDLPIVREGFKDYAPWIAASARPWPGQVAVYRQAGSTYELNRNIDSQATKGRLLDTLSAGPRNVFDFAANFTVKLDYGALQSVSEVELLQGANVAAVGEPETGYEILQFLTAELVAADTYKVSGLLRGQGGSDPELLAARGAGQRFVRLNGAVKQPDITAADAALAITWRLGPAQYDIANKHVNLTFQGKMLGLRPLAPCGLKAARDGGDVVLSWIRRTRLNGDSWDVAEVPLGEDAESYVLDVMSGSTVKRSVTLAAPSWRYASADITADFGGDVSDFTIRIAQMSASFGRGAALQETIHV